MTASYEANQESEMPLLDLATNFITVLGVLLFLFLISFLIGSVIHAGGE